MWKPKFAAGQRVTLRLHGQEWSGTVAIRDFGNGNFSVFTDASQSAVYVVLDGASRGIAVPVEDLRRPKVAGAAGTGDNSRAAGV